MNYHETVRFLLQAVSHVIVCIKQCKLVHMCYTVLLTVLYLQMTKIGQFFDASIFWGHLVTCPVWWARNDCYWIQFILDEYIVTVLLLSDLTPSLDGSGIDWLSLALKIAFLIFRQFVRRFSGNLCVVVILIKLVPCPGKPCRRVNQISNILITHYTSC